jgi:3-oxoacyl-[acyl-carrier protein] reductase
MLLNSSNHAVPSPIKHRPSRCATRGCFWFKKWLLEIGWIWLTPPVQRTGVNTECKYLLLRHAFEALGAIRVQLRTHHLNTNSQRAIERLGAITEMQINLAGKTALVAGGNIGIGRAISLALAECGAHVALTYLTHDDQETVETIRALGRKGVALRMDATQSVEVNAVVEEAAARLGGHLDILINNVGGLVGRFPLATMTNQQWKQVIAVNLTSVFHCTRAVLPLMNRGWGRIVNSGSVAAHHGGVSGSGAYAAAKAAVHPLTRTLAKELAPRSITVDAVVPGFISHTPFHDTFTSPAAQAAKIAQTPLQRAGTPADVAGAILYLVSDLATFVTGEIGEINGGMWFV